MIRDGRFLLLDWRLFVLGCLLGGALVAALGVYTVSQTHAATRARGALCLAQLRCLQSRHLFTERFLLPADPCLALEVATR